MGESSYQGSGSGVAEFGAAPGEGQEAMAIFAQDSVGQTGVVAKGLGHRATGHRIPQLS